MRRGYSTHHYHSLPRLRPRTGSRERLQHGRASRCVTSPSLSAPTTSFSFSFPARTPRAITSTFPLQSKDCASSARSCGNERAQALRASAWTPRQDRKSTRLNSSHVKNSYAVFCLKKKKNNRYELNN